ncbi:methyltransferase family protein [Chryseobacterium sp. 52]|uniref:class I SAM-dependent methyltransferase n=1 Tax=Chryseobacterium sp. 52 TaxID=2035213 RepID=UPI000C19680A|nr:class I SAM-dependent methyltransferase [Chryseobacterium sp. 52]PIF46287.1 methyltransferase family protein [Chryseobacterium sp. 52]
MTEFWEEAFKDKQEMWGLDPTNSAIATAEIFRNKGLKKILIPGIGYGRNAGVFMGHGMNVTGIEISKTAIGLVEKHYGSSITIQHGSVDDMPFDNIRYDGIFCHALIHLLDSKQRKKLINDCYNQLAENGLMFFTAITKQSPTFGQGRLIGKDRYEQFGGVNMFFYDENSIQKEFETCGLYQIDQVMDNYPFHLIQCKK